MKFKRNDKKLTLNKATVTNLDDGQMSALHGGNADAAIVDADTKGYCYQTASIICCPVTNYSCPYPPTQNPIPACPVQVADIKDIKEIR